MLRRLIILAAVVLAILIVVLALVSRIQPPSLTERAVRQAVFTTIQQESPEAFLITGSLELTATARVEDTRILLPGILGLDLGTTRATVRAPGRISYGFYADSLHPRMVRLLDDGTIEVELPRLTIYSVEPRLAGLEVETVRGWARLGSGDTVERQALAIVENALRRQGIAHIAEAYEPRINTARALERMLGPSLQGLGMDQPRFRFRLAEDLVVEPRGGDR